MIEKKKKKKGNELYYSARINRRVSTDHSSPLLSHQRHPQRFFFFTSKQGIEASPPSKEKSRRPVVSPTEDKPAIMDSPLLEHKGGKHA